MMDCQDLQTRHILALIAICLGQRQKELKLEIWMG